MNPTPLNQIEDMPDGLPVVAIAGTVNGAGPIKSGTAKTTGNPWSLQNFVLSDGETDIRCTMWDAEEMPVQTGAHIHLQAIKNKKGQWSGITKKIQLYEGKEYHKLEIHALNIDWLNSKEGDA